MHIARQTPPAVASPVPGGTIELRLQRDLRVREHPEGRAPWVSAGSGIAVAGTTAWVVADDELHVGRFQLAGAATPGEMQRVLPGTLPADPKARKKAKPDIESVLVTPVPGGQALIGMPSGSKSNRTIGFLLPLDAAGGAAGEARRLDVAPLLASLAPHVTGQLNIEGTAIVGQRLLLAQRGNGPAGTTNAIIEAPLAQLLPPAGVEQGRVAATGMLESAGATAAGPVIVRSYDLGSIDGVRLGFTDIAALPGGRIAFTAAAERTDDPVNDGKITGSAVGVIAADGSIEQMRLVADRMLKLEGITPAPIEGTPPPPSTPSSSSAVPAPSLRVLLVADADDPTKPAPLYEAWVPTAALSPAAPV